MEITLIYTIIGFGLAGWSVTTHEEKKILYGKDGYKNLSIIAKRAHNLGE